MNTIRKIAIIACIAMLGVCCAGDYSMRKFYNEADSTNPLSHRIVDVDCVFEDGKFVMRSLPANLPSLFTIRFTAPENFTQGNVVVVQGKELPVRTPGMVSASSGLFAAGAVMHCDVDLDREIAFFWQNGNGAVGGVLPNLSYDEQFAGFYSLEGDKVYVKSLQFPLYKGTSSQTSRIYPHDIDNIKNLVDLRSKWGHHFGNVTNHSSYITFSADQSGVMVINKNWDASAYTAIVTLYYTCTDR